MVFVLDHLFACFHFSGLCSNYDISLAFQSKANSNSQSHHGHLFRPFAVIKYGTNTRTAPLSRTCTAEIISIIMDPRICHLQHSISGDVLADVMARLDGLALASVACTCTDLREVARGQSLWKQVCHSKWPSTAQQEAQNLISSSFAGGFYKFYADAITVISYDHASANHSSSINPDQPTRRKEEAYTSLSDFVSLVDVYYKNQCILSRVQDGIPEAFDTLERELTHPSWDMTTDERLTMFLNSPFKLDMLEATDGDHNYITPYCNEGLCPIPSPSTENVKSGAQDRTCVDFVEDFRMSWILLDKKAGKAVNLSSWKPLMGKRIRPYDGNYYEMQFGCVIPVEESWVPSQLARCTIVARFKMTERRQKWLVQWKELSLSIESMTELHVNGRNSLMILNQALVCSSRTSSQVKVEKGVQLYEKQKRQRMRKWMVREAVANTLDLFIEITLVLILYSAFMSLF